MIKSKYAFEAFTYTVNTQLYEKVMYSAADEMKIDHFWFTVQNRISMNTTGLYCTLHSTIQYISIVTVYQAQELLLETLGQEFSIFIPDTCGVLLVS